MRRPVLDKTKQKHRKGLWSPDEDQKLKNYIHNYGHTCWSSVAVNAGLERNGKSCRLRWINYLRPGLKRGPFSSEEEDTILTLHQILGNRWSRIAHHLPGRTDNEIKNYWHCYLKKRASKMAKRECVSEQIQGAQLSPSSLKSTPPDQRYESFENTKVSLLDSDRTIHCPRGAQMYNLPKVFFAEWLSQGHSSESSGNASDFKYTSECNNTGVFNNEMHQRTDDMLQSPLKLDDQFPESGLLEYFAGEFDVCCDDLYV